MLDKLFGVFLLSLQFTMRTYSDSASPRYNACCKTSCYFQIAGITNHEEYSLVRDLPESERERTLTLRRDKSIAKDQKKMDEMKKKLHTDDECNSVESFIG